MRNSSDVMNVSIIKLYCIGVIVGPTSLLYSTKGFFTPTVIYPSTGAMLICGIWVTGGEGLHYLTKNVITLVQNGLTVTQIEEAISFVCLG